MSKSKKNVIDPNVLLERYGADTTRLFCLFAAPPERDLEWSEQGVEGGYRFLNRVWRLAHTHLPAMESTTPFTGRSDELSGNIRDLFKKTHGTIHKVTNDIEERFHFNTAISAVMELINMMYTVDPQQEAAQQNEVLRLAMESVILLLAPFVPHFADELWQALGHSDSVVLAAWPAVAPEALQEDDRLIVVQVNGKLRGRFTVSPDAAEAELQERALSDAQVAKFIEDKPIKKIIVVKGKLVNIVV